MNASHADSEAPNCWQCRHFSVSWDPNLPYACRLMGFKTRIMPAIEVLRADGSRCQGFSRKTAGGVSGLPDGASEQGAIATSVSSESSASPNSPAGSKAGGLYSTFSKLA
ncbi:MAG: hypothetical protein ACKO4M_10900 [Betaproteobacteria bacterium]